MDYLKQGWVKNLKVCDWGGILMHLSSVAMNVVDL